MSASTDNARRTGPALEAMYRFLLCLVPAVERFPRSQKLLLGDRIIGFFPIFRCSGAAQRTP